MVPVVSGWGALQGPLVAIGVGEVDERAPGLLVDVACPDAAPAQLVARGGRIGHDHLQAPLRSGCHVGDADTDHDRARGAWRCQLDEPQTLVHQVVVVGVETHLFDVELLGAIDIGHWHRDDLELHLHVVDASGRVGQEFDLDTPSGYTCHVQHSHHGQVHDHDHGHDKHAGHDPEMFRRKFWMTLLLTVPIVATSEMVMDWFGYTLDFPGMSLVGPVLGSVVFLSGGWPFLAGGVAEVRDRAPGMMLLISMAITVAYVASLATSIGWFDLEFWWELAALVTIMLFGHWQEMKAIGQAQGALAALAELLPDDAERIGDDGSIEVVFAANLTVDDVVIVRPGARVPADGTIVGGAAELDESMITGESRPVAKSEGDRVVAGTVATDSAIRVRVTAVGDDTALAGIQRLVAEAQQSRGRAQVLADRFAALLFYVAAGAGLLTFLVWWGVGDLDEAVVRTVTVLVIACPHALGLAIPLVISISTAVAAKAGILVKDRLALERMRQVDAVLFDKTGTLTRGAHVVTDVAPADGVAEDDLVRIAGAVESDSEHPLARAIAKLAADRGLTVVATEFLALPGRGVQATVDGVAYAVGGPGLLRDLGASRANRSREPCGVMVGARCRNTPSRTPRQRASRARRPGAGGRGTAGGQASRAGASRPRHPQDRDDHG